ncbi:hypothetical protein HU200_020545 [Digitaria exilis]|uniref:Rx N-terminal domain-containing protein n=1 Tax=Digitaria exilis TaxID=1010633 RepID=A0A835F233_9POAL|nr:hypothetical protein HU200_020545 [Digitaria exilis]
MAELAAGAVSSLLVVIRNEALLLGGVRDDVQFIKEEMESMNSFLAHLARSAPPGGEHDEQVRTWMTQVRLLAQDCNNCIDLYLYNGNPEIHRARGGLRRYIWWLRQLKDRARDVGERRLRYGVEVPGKKSSEVADLAAASSSLVAPYDEDDDRDEEQMMVNTTKQLVVAMTHHYGPKAFFEPRILDDYVKVKLLEWRDEIPGCAGETQSIAIVALNADKHILGLAHETLVELPYYHRGILVDIPAVHPTFPYYEPLRPKEILYYILRELKQAKTQSQRQDTDQSKGEGKKPSFRQVNRIKARIYRGKKMFLDKIKGKIEDMKIHEKLDMIKSQVKNKDIPVWDDNIIKEMAKKFKKRMEADEMPKEHKKKMGVKDTVKQEKEEDIEGIEVKEEEVQEQERDREEDEKEKIEGEKRKKENKANQTSKIIATALDEERIKQMIHEAKQEVLREMQEGKQDMDQTRSKPIVLDQNQKLSVEEITQMIEKLEHEFREQIKIKGLVDKILKYLGRDCPLIILKVDDMMDGSRWEEIRKALSLLKCSADALVFTTTESISEAKGYCYPPREPIDYSLVGLYHDTVLEVTSKQKNEDNPNPQVFRDILEECYFFTDNDLEEWELHEFSMKIFTHALYANPNRRSEELIKLQNTLQALPKSFDILAKKMFMFSYNDLPKEYKSCLLYLAIFPKGQKIRRSTLIERWVTEGLILKEDWPSSVHQANRCFDALIRRWLVYPADIGATGKVKSCVVGDLVHGFITKIARKQHFVETRLSHHLARHFSIFNDLQLRSSDKIDMFFEDLYKSSRVSLLKVLDLEGCRCFGGKNQRYLKDICTKMLLLKYLSLRGTDITQLPNEINNLRELEVLDIRQTKVLVSATTNILLLKLKRLLAGDIGPSSGDVGSVHIPHRIGKMLKVEVLSNARALSSDDLKDIGKLWQLRKLGLVIDDKDRHLGNLLEIISDLHECLCSLSITFPVAMPREDTPANLPDYISKRLTNSPKILESLSIRGTTLKGNLLPVIINGDNSKLTKVTLIRTLLNQNGLNILAKLPKLQCVRLRHITFTEHELTFKEEEFRCLKYLLVEGSGLTNITFEDGAARELEKLVLSFTGTMSISGAENLPNLEELELNYDSCSTLLPSFDDAAQIAKLTLRGALLNQDALQVLAKKPNLRCLVLSGISFEGTENEITFKKDEFVWLNLLHVDCPSITKITFTTESAPRLEKIVWPSSTALFGIDNLPRLKELEFKGYSLPKEVKDAIGKHKNKPSLKYVPAN